MRWDHIDPMGQLWLVPGAHAKNLKPHTVHLSVPSRSLLKSVPHTGELVFSVDGKTPFQGYSKAKAKLDELSRVSGWTLHDLRRTVVSGMAALGVAPHVADKILNHQTGTIFRRGRGLSAARVHEGTQRGTRALGGTHSSTEPPIAYADERTSAARSCDRLTRSFITPPKIKNF